MLAILFFFAVVCWCRGLCCRLYKPVARKPWLTVYRAHAGFLIRIIWLVETVETDNKAASKAIVYSPGGELAEVLKWLVETVETDNTVAV